MAVLERNQDDMKEPFDRELVTARIRKSRMSTKKSCQPRPCCSAASLFRLILGKYRRRSATKTTSRILPDHRVMTLSAELISHRPASIIEMPAKIRRVSQMTRKNRAVNSSSFARARRKRLESSWTRFSKPETMASMISSMKFIRHYFPPVQMAVTARKNGSRDGGRMPPPRTVERR